MKNSANGSKTLSHIQIQQNKQEILSLLEQNTRAGELGSGFYEFLNQSDYFTAPASTQYHEAFEGGLAQHSLKVYAQLQHLNYQQMAGFSDSSVAKTALLHDVCKVNFYTLGYRNKRMEDGRWLRVQEYQIKDQLPLGHGEKSVILLLQHEAKLTEEEQLAIRWHMGAWSPETNDFAGAKMYNAALERSNLVLALHIADQMATRFENAFAQGV